MCKIPDYIEVGVHRMNDFLPIAVEIKTLAPETKKKIPFGLGGAYDFYETEIMGKPFLLAGVDGDEWNLATTVITKQRDILEQETGIETIFIFNKLESYNFQRYAKKGLNMVVGVKQLFLPSIFLVASKSKVSIQPKEDKPPVFFQLLTLYHLGKENLDGLTTREIAKKMNTSYATVNRGIRWMTENGFLRLSEGKEKKIEFVLKGKKLWEKAMPYLTTPIDFIVYTPEIGIAENSYLSELNALAEYTLINGGPYRVAISKEEYKVLKQQDIYWDPFGECGIEVWKYDPALLAKNGVIDKLSLYLMLKDYDDERVQIELDNMMNEIEW
ncbi:MAG: hypothetical protein K2M31_04530 [Muribaculaceae bacterium]|nr:hypothetical protein [Muribaculaceae bacterium]